VALFDFAVHSGVSAAIRALQTCIQAPNTGRMEPETVAAMGDRDPLGLALAIHRRRVRHLTGLVKSKPARLKYLRGWMNRTHDMVAELVGHA
jgi:lysozyme family protein